MIKENQQKEQIIQNEQNKNSPRGLRRELPDEERVPGAERHGGDRGPRVTMYIYIYIERERENTYV